MQPQDSPWPLHWWGVGLDNVGLEDVRPNVGTYGRYGYAQLPPLPFEMKGDFGWLESATKHDFHIGCDKANDNAKALVILKATMSSLHIPLPSEFTLFMSSPSLHSHIRSNTDCFLNLCPEPIPSPAGNGFLIRFLADSQGCLFWSLYITEDGSDHAVVASPGFYGTDDEAKWEEEPDPSELVFSAESFEAFLCRFWVENEIWFSEYESTPMPNFGALYIKNYGREA